MTENISQTGNHLGIPKPNETNPNLLSPEILNQRRGMQMKILEKRNGGSTTEELKGILH